MSTFLGGGSSLFTLVQNPPASSSSPGTPFQVAFDASGNLYICYKTNTWAKYTNVPFGPAGTVDSQPVGMP